MTNQSFEILIKMPLNIINFPTLAKIRIYFVYDLIFTSGCRYISIIDLVFIFSFILFLVDPIHIFLLNLHDAKTYLI